MADTDLLTMSEVLQRLGTTAESLDPTVVEPLISAVTQQLERATGAYFVVRQYVETVTIDTPGWKDIFLHRRPITSVVSIIDESGQTIESTEYTVLQARGRLRHTRTWPMGVWFVTVLGGWFPTTAQVGEDLKREACRLLQAQRTAMESVTSGASGPMVAETVGPVTVHYGQSSSSSASSASVTLPDAAVIAPYRNIRIF